MEIVNQSNLQLNIDRLDFLEMFAFLKPVIDENSNSKNCVFVRVEKTNVFFTAGNDHVAKKAPLVRHIDIEEHAGGTIDRLIFIIPFSNLKAFADLLKSHKKINKKKKESDPSKLLIRISPNSMTSNGSTHQYCTPEIDYIDFEPYFDEKNTPTANIVFSPADVIAAITGFSEKITQICASDNNPIIFRQYSNGFEAAVIPVIEKEDDGKTEF